MTTKSGDVVIVGASLTGATVARTLREEGFGGDITLVGDEAHQPYERPALSKGVLRGEDPIGSVRVLQPSFYDEAQIKQRFGVLVERIDLPNQHIKVSTGEAVPYGTLVLATGGRPRLPRIPGIGLDGIHVLRTLDDVMRIRRDLDTADRAVVVGMGFIGSEVAASLRQLGKHVTAIEAARVPLAGPLGLQVGGVVQRLHADYGVHLLLGERVARFEGAQRVERVVTVEGRVVPSDLVILGLGMEPNVGVASGTAIRVHNGIVVDEFGRTSVGSVYAAGDVANHWHPTARRHLRVEHRNNAMKHGAAVARAIAGRGEPYDPVHFFWTEQFGRELEYYGLHEPWDDVIVRGCLRDADFLAVYRSEDRVVAAVSMGRSDDLKRVKELIAARTLVPRDVLADEDVDLGTLAPPESGIAA